MSRFEDFNALSHKVVPFSATQKTAFQYQEITFVLGAMIYNPAAEALSTSLSWTKDEVDYLADGIIIKSGVNIIQQYNAPLPSLVAVNTNGNEDITDVTHLELYLVVEYDEYFRGI